MPASIPFLCRFHKSVDLPAGEATVINVPTDGARNWLVVVVNSGDTNPLTAATAAASPLGTLFEAPTSITTGIPLAAGDALPGIRGLGEPVTTLRLTLTSDSGTTVSIEAGGW